MWLSVTLVSPACANVSQIGCCVPPWTAFIASGKGRESSTPIRSASITRPDAVVHSVTVHIASALAEAPRYRIVSGGLSVARFVNKQDTFLFVCLSLAAASAGFGPIWAGWVRRPLARLGRRRGRGRVGAAGWAGSAKALLLCCCWASVVWAV